MKICKRCKEIKKACKECNLYEDEGACTTWMKHKKTKDCWLCGENGNMSKMSKHDDE